MNKPKTVFRFKRKVSGGDWGFVMGTDKLPISITTDKGAQAVLHIFKHRYPSFANAYQLGETLIAEPNIEATKRLAEYERRKKEEEDKETQNSWWNN